MAHSLRHKNHAAGAIAGYWGNRHTQRRSEMLGDIGHLEHAALHIFTMDILLVIDVMAESDVLEVRDTAFPHIMISVLDDH